MRCCTIYCDNCCSYLEEDELDAARIEGELEYVCPYCGSDESIHLNDEEVVFE